MHPVLSEAEADALLDHIPLTDDLGHRVLDIVSHLPTIDEAIRLLFLTEAASDGLGMDIGDDLPDLSSMSLDHSLDHSW